MPSMNEVLLLAYNDFDQLNLGILVEKLYKGPRQAQLPSEKLLHPLDETIVGP
jgi:hypothetical protein